MHSLSCSGIGASFTISGVILMVSVLLYALGTLLQVTCNDFAPPEHVFLSNTVDNQTLWNGKTLLGAQFNVNLSISTTLRSVACEPHINIPITDFQALL